MNSFEATAENASRLLMKAVNPRTSPYSDKEYARLLRLYADEGDFQELVKGIATGLGLRILFASDYGMVLGVSDMDSRFALRLGDLNRHFQNEDKGAIMLVMLVVTVAFFPTAEALEDEDYGRGEFLRPEQLVELIAQYLHEAQERSQAEESKREDVEGLESGEGYVSALDDLFAPSWRYLESLPLKKPEELRASKGSREGLVRHVLNFYQEHNLVEIHEVEGGLRVTATERFRHQARELFGHELFQYVMDLKQQRSEATAKQGGGER